MGRARPTGPARPVAQWPERLLAITSADNSTADDADVAVVATPWDALAAMVEPGPAGDGTTIKRLVEFAQHQK